MKLISSEDLKFDIPQFYSYRHLCGESQILLTGQSTTRAKFAVTFVKAPFGGYSYEYATMEPNRDITIYCHSLDIPAHAIFDSFVSEWNKYHRHPLWPLVSFELRDVCKLTPGHWVQGSLKSVLDPIKPGSNGALEIEYRVIRNNSFEEKKSQQIGMLLAWERMVGMVPPSSWITPSRPIHCSSWMQVSTLSFVGSGSEIHPHITYPPTVAAHIWVPRQWESVGLNPLYLTQRLPCSKISVCSPKALEKGGCLSKEEAYSLVGRTVQFAIKAPMNQKIMFPSENKGQCSRSPPDYQVLVFISFIWGFDPERMILRGIERESTERCRSFFVGNEKRFPVVDDRAAWRNANRNELEPIRPLWIGAIETSGERQ
ncbi:hypothetical protein K435DRAFT_452448 [Dendrothele bispora CBS 962.96]|uniref:Uncharacterized protein n=1 Tax=Dendrothele bispora (strain CBS 962.96) TaxID=1314807 RepID=A0A4S8MU53_DENBC|nr:hypothetical protein K435DRAFT_452448 [Dendrothele bispora CBS 962.96]